MQARVSRSRAWQGSAPLSTVQVRVHPCMCPTGSVELRLVARARKETEDTHLAFCRRVAASVFSSTEWLRCVSRPRSLLFRKNSLVFSFLHASFDCVPQATRLPPFGVSLRSRASRVGVHACSLDHPGAECEQHEAFRDSPLADAATSCSHGSSPCIGAKHLPARLVTRAPVHALASGFLLHCLGEQW